MPHDQVTLYWRPGCPYCIRLRWQLRWAKLPVQKVNIWRDPAAAARVREITGGDETVPTVIVGERAMVNPSRAQVLAAVRGRTGEPPPA
ncbi:MAG TPA: glutaredoxin domain-containing protein [Streptosporangiaceae bacterium]|nr:glutaredoxin domain-containing protein [Streptosporangiaceae bacterium]